ncbi:MAG: sulfatase [Alphaproteobacteria bacterium]|nr:sulfatase [Alphaproteobacteria bacterium]
MWKRALIAVLALITIGAGLAWLNRKAIILTLVTSRGKMEVAQTRPVDWMKGPLQPASSRADGPPNIVFILADDLGINDISTFGGGVAGGSVKTPNIDRLAAQGALFPNAYSGTATCAPSRAMLMTGRYPTRTGFEFTPTPNGMGRIVSMFAEEQLGEGDLPPMIWNKEAAESGARYADMGLPPEEVTIAEILKASGYHTVHIGKWHLGHSTPFRAVSQGFDESLLMASGLSLPETHPDTVNAKLDFDPIDKFLWAQMQFAADFDRAGEEPTDEPFAPPSYITDYYTDEALKVIEANRNRPFFLYLAHWGVHTPLQATREDYEAVGDIEPHRERVYAAMVRALDRSVGRVLDKLEAEGLSDNTIVVFSSDNGGAGYIGLPEVNAPYRGWKITLFEGGIRVPMFVSWPGRIAPGTIVEEPVAHIDVLPTLVAAAGASLPAGVEIDGQNMLPAAMGEGRITRPDQAIFWSSGFYKVVRAGDWKLQVNERQEKSWLFDLATDPTEQTNLAEARPDKLAELQRLIEAHWAGARPPLYPHTTESPIRIDKTNADPPVSGDEYIIWPN